MVADSDDRARLFDSALERLDGAITDEARAAVAGASEDVRSDLRGRWNVTALGRGPRSDPRPVLSELPASPQLFFLVGAVASCGPKTTNLLLDLGGAVADDEAGQELVESVSSALADRSARERKNFYINTVDAESRVEPSDFRYRLARATCEIGLDSVTPWPARTVVAHLEGVASDTDLGGKLSKETLERLGTRLRDWPGLTEQWFDLLLGTGVAFAGINAKRRPKYAAIMWSAFLSDPVVSERIVAACLAGIDSDGSPDPWHLDLLTRSPRLPFSLGTYQDSLLRVLAEGPSAARTVAAAVIRRGLATEHGLDLDSVSRAVEGSRSTASPAVSRTLDSLQEALEARSGAVPKKGHPAGVEVRSPTWPSSPAETNARVVVPPPLGRDLPPAVDTPFARRRHRAGGGSSSPARNRTRLRLPPTPRVPPRREAIGGHTVDRGQPRRGPTGAVSRRRMVGGLEHAPVHRGTPALALRRASADAAVLRLSQAHHVRGGRQESLVPVPSQ